MGSWSRPSKRLLQSFEVELFEVSFEDIGDALKDYGIVYDWGEKDTQQVTASWQKFTQLSQNDRRKITRKLLATIEPQLRQSLKSALDESTPRKVSKVILEIRSTRGETFVFTFPKLKEALEFIKNFDERKHIDTSTAPTFMLNDPGVKKRSRRIAEQPLLPYSSKEHEAD